MKKPVLKNPAFAADKKTFAIKILGLAALGAALSFPALAGPGEAQGRLEYDAGQTEKIFRQENYVIPRSLFNKSQKNNSHPDLNDMRVFAVCACPPPGWDPDTKSYVALAAGDGAAHEAARRNAVQNCPPPGFKIAFYPECLDIGMREAAALLKFLDESSSRFHQEGLK